MKQIKPEEKNSMLLFLLIHLSLLWVDFELCDFFTCLEREKCGKIFEYTFYLKIFWCHKQDLGGASSTTANKGVSVSQDTWVDISGSAAAGWFSSTPSLFCDEEYCCTWVRDTNKCLEIKKVIERTPVTVHIFFLSWWPIIFS